MSVDFAAKTATISATSSGVTRAACEKALDDAGYGIVSFTSIANE